MLYLRSLQVIDQNLNFALAVLQKSVDRKVRARTLKLIKTLLSEGLK